MRASESSSRISCIGIIAIFRSMKLVDVSIYGKQNYSLVETERDLEGFYIINFIILLQEKRTALEGIVSRVGKPKDDDATMTHGRYQVRCYSSYVELSFNLSTFSIFLSNLASCLLSCLPTFTIVTKPYPYSSLRPFSCQEIVTPIAYYALFHHYNDAVRHG